MRALRDEAIVAEDRGAHSEARQLAMIAAARNLHDTPSQLMRLNIDVSRRDLAGVARDIDVVLRAEPSRYVALTPLLGAVVAAGGGAEVASHLVRRPPWRELFLVRLAQTARDPGIVFALLKRLSLGPAKPTPDELGAYFDRRLAQHDYSVAYLDWLQLLPPSALARVGNIYDGDFSGAPGPPPFNWRLSSGPGGSADILSGSGGRGLLEVAYDGVSTAPLATEMLVLPPGAYRLTGRSAVTQSGSGSLGWTLTCASSESPLARTTIVAPADDSWIGFAAAFTIPDQGCQAQWLRLTPHPGDRSDDISGRYTGLRIERVVETS